MQNQLMRYKSTPSRDKASPTALLVRAEEFFQNGQIANKTRSQMVPQRQGVS